MLLVENKNGTIYFEELEIIMFIEEQIKLIPGILLFRKNSFFKNVREILNLTTGKVQVSQINSGEIFINIAIYLKKEMNYIYIEEEIYALLEYSLKKKYGLTITNIEIVVQNLI